MGRREKREAVSTPAAPLAAGRSTFAWPVVFVLIGIGSFYLYRTAVDENRVAPPSLVVQREHLEGRSYREIAEQRKPVIVTGSVAHRWPAARAFTSSFLAEKLPWVMAHKQEKMRNFITFHDNKPLEPLVNERWEEFNVKVNVSVPEILQWHNKDRHPSRGPYLYFSQDIATLSTVFPDVVGYVQPIKDLILSEEDVQVNLWIGRAGIVTHTHYDCTYNFFVQLQGRKRFTLFPPDSPMYLFPCLHPHYGHSQVDILEPSPSAFPLYTRAGSWVAEVLPGDMLVVPPFWFHHVETLEESVSVNVWSDAPEYDLLNQIYQQPIPFEESWDWAELATATRIYTDMILWSIVGSNTPKFIQDLLSQRYQPLVDSGNIDVSEIAVSTVQKFCCSVDWEREKLHLGPPLERGLSLLEPLFAQIPTRATRDVCVGNYIEHLLHRALGLDYVYPFLKNCLVAWP